MSQSPISKLPVLPDSFPRNPKGCEVQTSEFFQCFSSRTLAIIKPVDTNGEPLPRSKKAENEQLAAAMKDCSASLEAYTTCLAKVEKTKPAKRFRVPEEYKRLMDQS